MGAVYNTICGRRTIRRFQKKSVSNKILVDLVNAARLAPSAANIQPCEFVIVNESGLVKKIFPNLKWADYIAPDGNPPLDERPVAYIVVLIDVHRKKKGGEVDAAAGIVNILLAAWEKKIGTCWIGSLDRKKIKTLLRIPHHLKLDSIVALGYPAEHPVIVETKESIKYWKDDRGIMHIPKRKLEEICHYNIYAKAHRKRFV